jgi:DNA-binding Xre family transcriptional regulator
MKVVNRFNEQVARKERREDRRITNAVIQDETGLALNTISDWRRNNVTRFDAEVILLLCRWVPCSVGELLVIEGEEDPNKKWASRIFEMPHSLNAVSG